MEILDYSTGMGIDKLGKFRLPEEVNILHISDLHFGVGKTDREKDNYRKQRKTMIISLIKELREYHNEIGSWKPDIVVVSGDIAYSGICSEYDEYIEDFYNIIKDSQNGFGLEDDCIIECPGNHDIIRENTVTFKYGNNKDFFPRPKRLKEGETVGKELVHLSKWGVRTLNRDNIGKNIEEPLVNFFHDYIIKRCDGDPQKIVRLQTPARWPWVNFIILNSAWDCREKTQKENDKGRLRVGLSFLEDLLPPREEMKERGIYCAVFHHPFLALTTDDGKGGKIVQNWLAASEEHPIHEGEDCFVNRVKTLKCIMNGHVHTAIKPEYTGNNAQTGFWSVCGTLFSNDTSKYHCRVIKIGKNGSIYCLDLETTLKGAADAEPWKKSCMPGNDVDEQLWKKAKEQQEKLAQEMDILEIIKTGDRALLEELLSQIISNIFSKAIIDSELIGKIIEWYIKDNILTMDGFTKTKRKEP